jgi:uncharacterized protein YdcH (DUF465 family)
MSDGDVERVMKLAFCNEDEARAALAKTHDVIDAVDMILDVPVIRGAPKPRVLSAEQQEFARIRANMEALDKQITKTNQSDSSSLMSTHTPALVQEEMSLRSDCIQSSQIPVQESTEQKQETACP